MTTETTNKTSYLISKHCKQMDLLSNIQELEKDRTGLLKDVHDPIKGPSCSMKLIYNKTQSDRLWDEYNKI